MSVAKVVPGNKEEMHAYQQWFLKETDELEHQKQELADELEKFEKRRAKFEREKRAFKLEKDTEKKFRMQEEQLLLMKQKVLEDELRKLADEKSHMERQKEFYNRVYQYQQRESGETAETSRTVQGELFFMGVRNELALKKRYKDLVRIYHPDNPSGDTGTLQEMNKEYDKLCLKFAN